VSHLSRDSGPGGGAPSPPPTTGRAARGARVTVRRRPPWPCACGCPSRPWTDAGPAWDWLACRLGGGGPRRPGEHHHALAVDRDHHLIGATPSCRARSHMGGDPRPSDRSQPENTNWFCRGAEQENARVISFAPETRDDPFPTRRRIGASDLVLPRRPVGSLLLYRVPEAASPLASSGMLILGPEHPVAHPVPFAFYGESGTPATDVEMTSL
jgi:hypothetical protein